MQRTAQSCKALADETRLRIICLLLQGELCVCHLMAVLQLPQSTVSRHLSYLRRAGWVQDRRSGIWMHYSLSGQLDRFQLDILAALRSLLPTQETAVADRQRLQQMRDASQCATPDQLQQKQEFPCPS